MDSIISTLNLETKFNQVRAKLCFYLDVQNHAFASTISRKIHTMNLAQEVFLTPRVTHVVRDRAPPVAQRPRCVRRDAGRTRADAMLERVRTEYEHANYEPHSSYVPHTNYVVLSPEKAIILLDKLYDTFFRAHRKTKVRFFSKHFIKIEFLDKPCRPVYKEFDEWPVVSVELDPPKEKEEKKQLLENQDANIANFINTNKEGQKMTRKSRPRIKEREEKVQKKGYCEMCNTDYLNAAIHRRSPHHLAFVKDHTNFLALDSLIGAEADVTTFLDKATPLNGERRSLRKICNGEVEQPKNKHSKRSQSPDSTVNESQSPKRNGGLEDEKKHNTRCSKRSSDSQVSEDRQYYKVVGVSTKLRSSGGFTTKRKDSLPMCNGAEPLVVKFRKVRRSELSVLSDEAEQFMFPKRASSTSSTSSDDEKEVINTKRKSPLQPPLSLERRRLARPMALKEESSEEDSWSEDKRRRKRRGPATGKRARRAPCRTSVGPALATSIEPLEITPQVAEVPQHEGGISPLREEPAEKCMKWEDGKLKYTAAVEQLEFAFESVPHSEPWFETFKRQDQHKTVTKNVPRYFSLYSKSPKLPYELSQLPPLKPNCCPLSDLAKREDKPGPSRLYGTRGMKKQKIRRRTAAILALEGHPRKSPREHASTLAILGSAGLLHRRKHAEDAKSTASEDTVSDVHSNNTKVEPVLSETQEASERLQQFFSEVFEDAAEFDMSDDIMDGEATVTTSTNVPDVLSLVSECEDCDIIRKEIKENTVDRARGRRGKFKKKNRTGWPNKKKHIKKGSRANSSETDQKADSLDRSSAEPPDDDTTQDVISGEDTNISETENDTTLIKVKLNSDEDLQDGCNTDLDASEIKEDKKEDKSFHLDVNILLHNKEGKESPKSEPEKDDKRTSRSSASETEETQEKGKKRKRGMQNLGDWLQPIVRVTRVDPNVSRRLRSAGRARSSRYR